MNSSKEKKIAAAQLPKRLQSLDALRGFDMFFIMGGAALIASLANIWPTSFFQALADQMEHVEWHGFHHHDTIFPLFLFIAGISFPFSYAKQQLQGKSRKDIYKKIIKRGIILIILGIIYNGILSTFDFAHARYASVLARIGLGWMFAALIYINSKTKARIGIVAIILIGYYLVSLIASPDAPAGADSFSHDGCLEGYLDRMILPSCPLEGGMLDPEGVLSTIPAIATALLGMLTGEWVRRKDVTDNKKVLYMVAAGIIMLIVGLAWSTIFPINKKLWTSTFVLVVGAYSILMFALFYYIIDVRNLRKWSFPFIVIGMNPITIYLAQQFINFQYTSNQLTNGLVRQFSEILQPTLKDICYITVCWLFLYFLYRKRIFLKV
ncbi:MAG: acyltransferase family protein [Phocaeicola sp.]|uniref:acyltransferase family protein n=2 Tax=Bacteroidaceae TaxID=815 RepID=UPI00234F31E5|nr:DUF5009 domain-containing protein [Phocaeicola oris]MCE2616592.1 DUF5009 domain-containing protein [Phocaeicola oris]